MSLIALLSLPALTEASFSFSFGNDPCYGHGYNNVYNPYYHNPYHREVYHYHQPPCYYQPSYGISDAFWDLVTPRVYVNTYNGWSGHHHYPHYHDHYDHYHHDWHHGGYGH